MTPAGAPVRALQKPTRCGLRGQEAETPSLLQNRAGYGVPIRKMRPGWCAVRSGFRFPSCHNCKPPASLSRHSLPRRLAGGILLFPSFYCSLASIIPRLSIVSQLFIVPWLFIVPQLFIVPWLSIAPRFFSTEGPSLRSPPRIAPPHKRLPPPAPEV